MDILDDDGNNAYDFVDHFEYQYNVALPGSKVDAPIKFLHLVGYKTT